MYSVLVIYCVKFNIFQEKAPSDKYFGLFFNSVSIPFCCRMLSLFYNQYKNKKLTTRKEWLVGWREAWGICYVTKTGQLYPRRENKEQKLGRDQRQGARAR